MVLLWLKLWDNYVFKKKGPGLWDSLGEKDKALVEIEHRKGGQVLPKHKILVLYGGSGIGKSSLAQVVAQQAGYRPLLIPIKFVWFLEINYILSIFSELQNIAELRNRLENATNTTAINTFFHQQNSTLNQTPNFSNRPVCLIVEGLEQAPSEMVNFLYFFESQYF